VCLCWRPITGIGGIYYEIEEYTDDNADSADPKLQLVKRCVKHVLNAPPGTGIAPVIGSVAFFQVILSIGSTCTRFDPATREDAEQGASAFLN
jgi:hypothetical protein